MRLPLLLLLMVALQTQAQNPYRHFTEAIDIRYDSKQPVIHYTLEVDTANLSFINVEMRIGNIGDSCRVATFVHPEYDDRFYRFIEELKIEKGSIERLDKNLWSIHTTSREVVIHYKIHLPEDRRPRAAWKPFLSSTGALIGGPQCYMYVVGATLAPSYVHLRLPESWQVATALEATIDPQTFFSPTAAVLFDSPILAGQLKQWSFDVDGVPHKIVYWPSSNFKAFDTTTLVSSIQKLVQQANQLFGRLPYRDYSFLLQDDAYGALEHAGCVTIGLPSQELSNNMNEYLEEVAHEYFHAWNIVRIHPAEYGDVSYTKPTLSKGLWWSEGLTMFYADVLLRRSGMTSAPRVEHLKNLISRYFFNPGNNKLSAEEVSMAAYAPPGFSGDYDGSTHLQGELIGTVLDIFIRDATNRKRSMDDVMRKMMERFSGTKGFTSNDIEHLVEEVCGRSVHRFFEDHIGGNKAIDFNTYLKLIGLVSEVNWIDAKTEDGKNRSDLRVYAYQLPDDKRILIGIDNPSSCWGKAGLHTGDQVVSLNDSLINTTRDFYAVIRSAKIGDQIRVAIKRKEEAIRVTVTVSGYRTPAVTIREITVLSNKQKQLLNQWQEADTMHVNWSNVR